MSGRGQHCLRCAVRINDPELYLNRRAVIFDEAVLHRLVIDIARVQERRVNLKMPFYRMLEASPILSQRSEVEFAGPRAGRGTAYNEDLIKVELQPCRQLDVVDWLVL